ncbi:MAG: DUF1326 domain-containing protein [Alphaproteobacteria bacterium]|nr:DUF1326 domain-containing protein [Alphaproteobacteria bacterium]
MAETNWALMGKYVEFCSCDRACPCDGAAAPTHGHCNGIVGLDIERGHYGDVALDGLSVVAIFHFPGAMHHCDGHLHTILSEDASDAQRDALFEILSGDGQPTGSIFDIFDCLIEHRHAPLLKPIKFDWDIANGNARVDVPGVVRAATEAGDGSATGTPAAGSTGLMLNEGGSGLGSAESTGDIAFELNGCHASLSQFTYDESGMTFAPRA